MRRPCEAHSSAGSEVEESSVSRQEIISGHLKASFIRCGSPTLTTQVMARKRRRGIIEKRRRDRINNSLSELRRLVPAASEKQGSAKLEKAEILQMTVDHLKMLQMTGGKGHLDTSILALDFLSLGFRECVTEVSHYLSSVEALDSSEPLCSRLLSHLNSCTSQRDTAAMTATSHQQSHPFPRLFPAHHWAALRPLPYGLSGLTVSPDSGGGDAAPQRLVELPQHNMTSSLVLPSSLLSLSASFPITFHRGFPLLPPSSSSSSQPPPGSSRAYRPWDTEVGAF